MIKSIKISGYKSLQDSEVKFTAPFTAIVGRNNVGKSNLFDALKILSGLVQAERAQSVFSLKTHRGTPLESFSSKDEPVINIEVELDLTGAKHPTDNTLNPIPFK